MKKVTLHVSGTHCNSCKILIEDVLNSQVGITNTNVNLKDKLVTFDTDLSETPETLASVLSEKIKQNGYSLYVERKTESPKDKGVIWQALPIGLGALLLFFFVQKSGVLNLGFGGTVTPVTSFIIGLVASVSSCLAVVGGLVLSLSATVSQDNVNDTKSMLLFHFGRLFGFALLGGVLGAIGSAIGINLTLTALLGVVASVVMIGLGLNLVGVFERNKITLPSSWFNFFRRVEHKAIAPLLVGVGTFFLPCGFTQAMQVGALSSGSFVSGAFIMGTFALGTLPMLALLSFGSASLAHSKHSPLFFKSAGVVVLGLGLFALLSGLAGLGVIDPLFSI